MAMLRLAAHGEVPLIFDPEAGERAPALSVGSARAAAPGLRRGTPIVVLVHGFKFDPFDPAAVNPNDYLYHFDPDLIDADRWGRPASWPLGLGFREGDRFGHDGLCVGFAWRSMPRVRYGRFYAAYSEAERAGRALLRTLDCLAQAFPGRDIDLFTHSLGARVALSALRHAAEAGDTGLIARIGRVLLLGPAELTVTAQAVMEAVDAAMPERSPQVFSVSARENAVFDAMVERFAPRPEGISPTCLGTRGIGAGRPDWLDLRLDRPALRDWLGCRGIEIGGGVRRACHWGLYNRPGALGLYAAILREREAWSIAGLRRADIPEGRDRTAVRGWAPRLLPKRRDQEFAETGLPAM